MPRAKIDPTLLRQLDEAERSRRASGASDVQAVFALAGSDAAGGVPTREGTRRTVEAVLDRARAASGAAPTDVNVFANLGRFVVAAPPAFLRAVAAQPEVSTATANRRSGSMRIPPPRARRAAAGARPASKRRPAR